MEKINKEYPILSNWKFVFKEMYDLDHKYPWYIAVRSVAGFLRRLLQRSYQVRRSVWSKKRQIF